jgi:glycosyltransferase involved in cell wall biosynthesis
MRICLVTENFYPETVGAVPILLSQLAQYLCVTYADLRIDVVASLNLASGSSERLPPFEELNGVRIFRVDSPPSKQPSMLKRLWAGFAFSRKALQRVRQLHGQEPYSLICLGTNPPSSPLVGRAMKAKLGVPYTYIVHDMFPDAAIALGQLRETGIMARIARRFQRNWLEGAAIVIVNGRCQVARLAEHYKISSGKVRVLENWSDPDAVVPAEKGTAFRASHGLKGFLVIYAGNIGYGQRLGTVLDAAKILPPTHGDVTFVLVGGGSTRDAIARRICDEGISNVLLIPAVAPTEYFELLASADVALVSLDPMLTGIAVPSKTYNILASGRPMLALVDKRSEVALLLAENDCGIQIDHDKGDDLAAAVMRLRDAGPLHLEEMGHRARAALEGYTLQRIAENYHRLFHEVVAAKRDSIPQ